MEDMGEKEMIGREGTKGIYLSVGSCVKAVEKEEPVFWPQKP